MSEQDPAKRKETIIILVASAIAVLLLLGVGTVGPPGAEQRREKAKQAACQNNLRQLTVAMLMYCQDYDQHYPMAYNWNDAIYPYLNNQSVYKCPSMPYPPCGYAYNAHLDRLPLKQLKAPADTVACYDALGGWNLAGDAALADPRHDEGLNVAFSDGHTKWLEQSELSAYTWDPIASGGGATGTTPRP